MNLQKLLFAGYLLLMLQACEEQAPVQQQSKPKSKALVKHTVIPPAHDTLCITAVGDIMLGTSYPTAATLPPDSGKSSFNAVQKYFKGSDVVFGNLEGTLLDKGEQP